MILKALDCTWRCVASWALLLVLVLCFVLDPILDYIRVWWWKRGK